jgi:hypothetical protein
MFKRNAVTLIVTLGLAASAHAQSASPFPNAQGNWTPPMEPVPSARATSLVADPGPIAASSADRVWISADYLLGFIRSTGVPPLVTTAPQGTAQLVAGTMTNASTTVLFGGASAGGDLRSGFQIGAGGWLDAERTFGIDVGISVLDRQNDSFSANSPKGNPILARPFLDTSTGTQTTQLVAFPGLAGGALAASAHTDYFYSANVDFKEVILDRNGWRIESILGYRFLRFDDGVAVDSNIVSPGSGLVAAGTQVLTSDRFTAHNTFHGVDIGIGADYRNESLWVGLVAKLGVGNVNRSIGIAGTTDVIVPGAAPVLSNGGLLALSSNSGVHTSHDWEVAPEIAVNIGWDITENVRVRVGYSFLYLTDVARAADQISLHINSNLFPAPTPAAGATPNDPAFGLRKSDIWMQAINVGFEVRF